MAQLEPIPAKPVATLDEVARVAGVSRATVSRVVNGSPKVSADVRRNVERVIDRLAYVPNRAEYLILTNRRILADQMEFLAQHVPAQSRLHQKSA